MQILARRATKQYTSECAQILAITPVGLIAGKVVIDDWEERR